MAAGLAHAATVLEEDIDKGYEPNDDEVPVLDMRIYTYIHAYTYVSICTYIWQYLVS